jgi:hypothetical protein
MYIQVMEARTSDRAGLRRRMDGWDRALKLGAAGYLGSTVGVAADGTVVAIARFVSQDKAEANAARPEQDAWWAATRPLLDGDVTFRDCPEVDVLLGGGSDGAGFVQVISGRARDKALVRRLEQEVHEPFPAERPDFLGGVVAWEGDRFTDVAYFTSEQDARAGEARMATGDLRERVNRLMEQVEDLTYVDIPDPWLYR